MQKLILISLFILFQTNIFSQNLDYQITFLGFDIGSFTVKNTKTDNLTIIQVNGNGVINFIKSNVIKFYSESRFIDNKLISAISYRYQNGEKTDSVFVIKEPKSYKVYSYVDGETHLSGINTTGNMLYYYEPNDNEEIFSENKGYFVTIKKIGDHKYYTYDEKKGERITYEYKNNLLVETIFEKGLITLIMKLKQ